MKRCFSCGTALRGHETVQCDDCHEALLQNLLQSEGWMRVRGPYLAEEFERELAAVRARKAYLK